MDKKHKPRRRKQPSEDEVNDFAPRGASFDTEAGRTAQGRRSDLGSSKKRKMPEGEEDRRQPKE